jgi:hypothetical protein
MTTLTKALLPVEEEANDALRALAGHLTRDIPNGGHRDAAILDAQAYALKALRDVCKEHVDRYHTSLDEYDEEECGACEGFGCNVCEPPEWTEKEKQELLARAGDDIFTFTLVDMGVLPPDWFHPTKEELEQDRREFERKFGGEG